MSSFGERLVQYRKTLGMNQRVLADRSGLVPAHLSRIEKGTRKPPRLKHVLSMVQELHLTYEQAAELLELAGYSPSVLQEIYSAQSAKNSSSEEQFSRAGLQPNPAERELLDFDSSRYPPRPHATMQERLWGKGRPIPAWYLSPEGSISAANLLAFWLWGSPLEEEIRRRDILGASAFEVMSRPWNFERIALPEKEDDFLWNTISVFKAVEQLLPTDGTSSFKTSLLNHPLLRLIYVYGAPKETRHSYKSFFKILSPHTALSLSQGGDYLEFWSITELIQTHLSIEGILSSYQPANTYTWDIIEREYQRLIASYGNDAFVQQQEERER